MLLWKTELRLIKLAVPDVTVMSERIITTGCFKFITCLLSSGGTALTADSFQTVRKENKGSIHILHILIMSFSSKGYLMLNKKQLKCYQRRCKIHNHCARGNLNVIVNNTRILR